MGVHTADLRVLLICRVACLEGAVLASEADEYVGAVRNTAADSCNMYVPTAIRLGLTRMAYMGCE